MPNHNIELLAETIYLAFISDGVPTYQHDWVHVTPRTKGDFRRAAQAALRTISDNRDWLLTDCEREGHEFALARAQELEARVEEALKFIDDYFAPWGSWKTAWWEDQVSDSAVFCGDNALRAVENKLRAPRQADERA